MKLIEWEVTEDSYQEQINIPKEIRELAREEGISTEIKQNAAVEILNLNTGGVLHRKACHYWDPSALPAG